MINKAILQDREDVVWLSCILSILLQNQ